MMEIGHKSVFGTEAPFLPLLPALRVAVIAIAVPAVIAAGLESAALVARAVDALAAIVSAL